MANNVDYNTVADLYVTKNNDRATMDYFVKCDNQDNKYNGWRYNDKLTYDEACEALDRNVEVIVSVCTYWQGRSISVEEQHNIVELLVESDKVPRCLSKVDESYYDNAYRIACNNRNELFKKLEELAK